MAAVRATSLGHECPSSVSVRKSNVFPNTNRFGAFGAPAQLGSWYTRPGPREFAWNAIGVSPISKYGSRPGSGVAREGDFGW